MRHVLLVAAGLAVLLTVALGANASGQGHSVGPLGIVPPATGGEHPAGARAASPPTPNVNASLTYHGGSVMRANTVYAIYWVPVGYTLPPSYQTIVNRYFADVAHDSHSSTNAYAASTQYYDTTGQIVYDSTFAGSAVDTNAYPASDCTMPSSVTGTTECLSENAIEAQVKAFADSKGWPHGPNTEFFVFTPHDVGSCFDSTARYCAYSYYCAYHDAFFDNSDAEYIFANMPFPNQTDGECDSGEHPNGSGSGPSDQNAADEVINVTSHEHNESITDPLGDAWWAPKPAAFYGYEDGDLCAWSWLYPNGPAGMLGGSMNAGSAYNQVINGHHYFIQGEWSNASATATNWSGCVWAFAGPVNTSSPALNGTATVGQVLTASAGSWDGSPTSYAYTWLRCDTGGANCKTISTTKTAATSATYTLVAADDRHTIRVGVVGSNTAGSSPTATSAASSVVNGEPVNTVAPALSGTATVGQTLTGNVGTWNPAATALQSQLFRCDASGAACVQIKSFMGTPISYVLTPTDDRHRLKLTVVAANAAGASDPATSSLTALVGGEPAGGTASITGTATVGQTLTGSSSGWSPAAQSLKFTWMRCDAAGANCVASSVMTTNGAPVAYKLMAADDKHRIRLSVVATNAVGSSGSVLSTATGIVNGEPVNTGAPAITGPTTVGQTLTASPGTWNPAATSYTYAWERCASDGSACTVVRSGTSTTYRVASADVGHKLRVLVTATNAAGSSTAVESAATSLI